MNDLAHAAATAPASANAGAAPSNAFDEGSERRGALWNGRGVQHDRAVRRRGGIAGLLRLSATACGGAAWFSLGGVS